MIYVLLAEGFEEIEAVTAIDILRRAGLETVTVGIGEEMVIKGAHGIPVFADTCDAIVSPDDDFDAVVLPGGMPGTLGLAKSDFVAKLLAAANEKGKLIAAVCAAPSVLGAHGLLAGRRATCYPGFESALTGAKYTGAAVETDGNIITGKGPGVTVDFAAAIVAKLSGEQTARKIKEDMQCVL